MKNKKKVFYMGLAASAFMLTAIPANAATTREADHYTVNLQNQANGDLSKVRFVSTITGVERLSKISGVSVKLDLVNSNGTVNNTKTIKLNNLYTSVKSGNQVIAPEADGTYYSVYTLSGITNAYDNFTIKASFTYTFSDGTTKTTEDSSRKIDHQASIRIITAYGAQESAYAEWTSTSATKFNVYAIDSNGTSTKLDNPLIRKYKKNGLEYYRADAVGLKAGKYSMKVVPVSNNTEDTSKAQTASNLTVTAYDRSGFAFIEDYKTGKYNANLASGAYNGDGTLRSNAVVLYVTENTKDTVSLDVVTNSKGGKTTSVGIQNILTSYQKGYETRPLAVRFIGKVTDPATLVSGDFLIKGNGDDNRLSSGITIEGIGEDATVYGFGIRLANVSNVEIRNIAAMLVDSGEGDNFTLQQSCDHIWVHNCDSFYGMPGGDADQIKGDGALDCKKSSYVTFSYNHFFDNGKCNLLGLSENEADLFVTYHHNWYDHSDSRHPRARFFNAHVYNNYYDGCAKYGIGATSGSNIFAEGNYFRGTSKPMLMSMQGTDIASGKGTFSSEAAGFIKAYNNTIEGNASFIPYSSSNSKEYDAYVAKTRDEVVSSSVKYNANNQSSTKNNLIAIANDWTYNNFDTKYNLGIQVAVESPEQAKTTVMQYAGRLNGGDFSWTFDNSVDDKSYAVNEGLMSAVKSYKGYMTAIQEGGTVSGGTDTPTNPTVNTYTVTFKDGSSTYKTSTVDEGKTVSKPTAPTKSGYTFAGWYTDASLSTEYNFSSAVNGNITLYAKWTENQGSGNTDPTPTTPTGGTSWKFDSDTDDDFVTYTGSSSDVKAEVAGTYYAKGVKLNSSGSVTFTLSAKTNVTIHVASCTTIKLNGEVVSVTNGTVSKELAAGTYTITKGDTEGKVCAIILDSEAGGSTGGSTGGNQDDSTTWTKVVDGFGSNRTLSMTQINDGFYANTVTKSGVTPDTTGTCEAVVNNGVLSLNDSNTTDSLYAIYNFGTAYTSGKLRLSTTVKPSAQKGSWSVFTINDGDKNIAIRTNSDKVLAVSINGGTDYVATFGSAITANTSYDITVEIDFDAKTLKVTIDGTTNTISGYTPSKVTGFQYVTASDARNLTIESIVVEKQ